MEITAISTMMEVRNWKLSINMNVSGLRFITKVSIKSSLITTMARRASPVNRRKLDRFAKAIPSSPRE